jgi:hypothetical protein
LEPSETTKTDFKALYYTPWAKRLRLSKEVSMVVAMCDHLEIPRPIFEHRFSEERDWRFDMAWPYHHIALEVEGGHWSGGGHTRGKGYEKDIRKYNEAWWLGWSVVRLTTTQVRDVEYAISTLERIKECLARSEAPKSGSRT